LKFTVENPEVVKNLKGPVLVIANHKTVFDHFIFGAALPKFSPLFAVRFMGEMDHFNFSALEFLRKTKIIRLFYAIFGVFPAIRGKGLDAALEKPQNILKNGGAVLIYPEGKVVKENTIGKFKKGAPALAIKTGITVLPVSINEIKTQKPHWYRVKFGEKFTVPQNMSVDEAASYMKSKISDLFETIKS
jgi:1-acyl-sn-glycerol-3-phosphate acyltransferase